MNQPDEQWLDNDTYRAIGHYVVAFSLLIRDMRGAMTWRVTQGGDRTLAELLLGEAMPKAVANAFFGMCRLTATLDRDELRVENILRRNVTRTIEVRNDFAHGDWLIGLPTSLAGHISPEDVEHPTLTRTLPNRSEGPDKVKTLSIETIDALVSDLEELTRLVLEFGCLALGLPVQCRDAGGDWRVSEGEVRVRDVLEAHGGGRGKNQRPATVTRSGPLATSVALIHY